jgi:hypothetical protein
MVKPPHRREMFVIKNTITRWGVHTESATVDKKFTYQKEVTTGRVEDWRGIS